MTEFNTTRAPSVSDLRELFAARPAVLSALNEAFKLSGGFYVRAAALRPARERADLSAEIVNQMQAVFALADDAAAIVMGIKLDDRRRRPSYERTAAAIMAD